MTVSPAPPRPATPQVASGTVVAGVLLALLLAGITYRYWPNDNRVVRRHLVHLAEALSVPGRETEVEQLTRVAVVREYFAPDVRVVGEGRILVTRDAVIAAIFGWTPPPGGFSIEITHPAVALAPDRSTARVAVTAKVLSKDLRNGAAVAEARDLDIAMAKFQGDWVITNAEVRPAAGPP